MTDDNPDGLKYDFDVAADSTYVRAAGLVAASATVGRVIDLGAGVGALGVAAASEGFGYIGFDANASSVSEMHRRGLDAHELDLNAPGVIEWVIAAAAPTTADPIVAVALLDVVEHLPDPDGTIDLLTELIDTIADHQNGLLPLLVLSVPNVAHTDLGIKLMMGQWDVTDVGLLDETHITLFTEQRLRAVLAGRYAEVGRNDVVMQYTEQRPLDHPGFTQTGLGAFLRNLRSRCDEWGSTYQFVRAYQRSDSTIDPGTPPSVRRVAAAAETGTSALQAPFCSVIVRTQGNRRLVLDALTSLAAQSDRDFEVLLMVHHDDADVVAALQQHVDRFDDRFASAVHLHHVVGGGRSTPLNAGLDAATGRYLAFLDDDDIVTARWVAEFRRLADLHPGSVIRCGCVEQQIEWSEGELFDVDTVSGFDAPYPMGYDLFDAVRANRSPLCSFAVPRAAVLALGIRFDPALRVCEDWKFQLDVVRHTGIVPSAEITSVYRRWVNGGASADESSDVWVTDIQRVVRDLDAESTLVPPGGLQRLFDLYSRIEQLEVDLGRRRPDQPPIRFTE